MLNRKLLLFSLICLITTINIKAQVEFAPIGATWYYDMGFYTNFWTYRSFYKAESVRDTVLLNITAKVIEFTYYNMNGDTIDWENEILYGDDEEVYHYDGVNYL